MQKKSLLGIVFCVIILSMNIFTLFEIKQAENEEEKKSETLQEWVMHVEDLYSENFMQRDFFIEGNGWFLKQLGIRDYYAEDNIYLLEDGYVVSAYEKTSTDYEFAQVSDFYSYLQEKDIEFCYINAPLKYLSDDLMREEFGVESYGNQNMDVFLSRLYEAEIPYIDLREEIKNEGRNIYEMFYRTDHHWTVPSGLWSASKIAEGLNLYCNYNIDDEVFNQENYSIQVYEDCWLGEQGRMVSKNYIGLDDFVRLEPRFDTDVLMKTDYAEFAGDFSSVYIDENYYSDVDNPTHDSPLLHYSYSPRGITNVLFKNNKIEDGKVLLLCDSYSFVTVPFLSMSVAEVTPIVMRGHSGNIREYIETHDFDAVVMMYAGFMIGAHDDKESSNYRMFKLN